MTTRIKSERRRAFLVASAVTTTLVSSHWAAADSYTFVGPTGGSWSYVSNWSSATGTTYPGTANDLAYIPDATSANQTVIYNTGASGSLGTLTISQNYGFVNTVDVQRQLTIANPVTLGASNGGTSRIYFDLPTPAASNTIAFSIPQVTLNAGGVLEFSNYGSSSSLYNQENLTGSIVVQGGTLFSDVGVSYLATQTYPTVISGSLTMTSGTISMGTNGPNGFAATYKSSGGFLTTGDRLSVNGNLAISGGTFTSNTAVGNGNNFYLSGATNTITGLSGPLNPKVDLVAGVSQSFASDSALPEGINVDNQGAAGSSVVTTVGTYTSPSTSTLSVGSIALAAKNAGSADVLQLKSNIVVTTNNVLNTGGNSFSSTNTLGIDVNGFKLDFSAATGTINFYNVGSDVDTWMIKNSNLTGVGTIVGAAFNTSTAQGGATITGLVNLVAEGASITSNLGQYGSGSTIDPTSTFTYAGTATGVGTLLSNRTIGNLVISSQTLDLGSAITTGTTSTTTVAAGGTLNLNGYALTTTTLTNNGGTVVGSTALSALSVTNTLSGTGTISAAAGIAVGTSSGGSLAPGGVGNVGTLKIASGSGALTLGSGNTSNFDIASSSSYDTMVLNSVSVTFGGTLNLNFIGTYAPALNTQYTIFSGLPAGESTNFTTINSNLSGYTFDFNDSTGVLTVDSVPEPVSVGLLGTSSLLLLRRRRRAIASPKASRIV
jgi:fibronectin-binding autotransporter adhesin